MGTGWEDPRQLGCLLTSPALRACIALGTAWEPGQLLQPEHNVLPAPPLLKIWIAAFCSTSSS